MQFAKTAFIFNISTRSTNIDISATKHTPPETKNKKTCLPTDEVTLFLLKYSEIVEKVLKLFLRCNQITKPLVQEFSATSFIILSFWVNKIFFNDVSARLTVSFTFKVPFTM